MVEETKEIKKKYIVDPFEGQLVFQLPDDYTPEERREAIKTIYDAYDKKQPLIITEKIKVYRRDVEPETQTTNEQTKTEENGKQNTENK